MAEQIRRPFEKFVDWRQCAAVMKRGPQQHKSRALPPVQEFSNGPRVCVCVIPYAIFSPSSRKPVNCGATFQFLSSEGLCWISTDQNL